MTMLEEQGSKHNLIKDELPAYKKGWTNNVFCIEKSQKILYYLPAYLRLKVKNIVSMDLFTLTGQVNCTFIISVCYGNMNPPLVQFLSESIEIAFHKSGALILNEKDSLEVGKKDDQTKKLLTFTVRKTLATKLEGEVFWSPFEKVNFIISLTMRSLKTQIQGKSYTIKFNLMNCQDVQTKFSLAQEWSYGIFRIAENMLEGHYSNHFSHLKVTGKYKPSPSKASKVNPSLNDLTSPEKTKAKLAQDDEVEPLALKSHVQNFQYAHFILPVYKKPYPAIITIYFPLLLLGVINIGIFFQKTAETGKIMLNIGALLVSFIALIPTVRQNTPVTPIVTFTQIMVFFESFTTILTLIHMLEYRSLPDYDPELTDGYIIACIVITALVTLSITVLIFMHLFYWKRKYHGSGEKPKGDFKFDHKSWYNERCDEYYFNQVDGIQQFMDEVQQSNIKRLVSKTTGGDWDQFK